MTLPMVLPPTILWRCAQDFWTHSIPKRANVPGPRINLTFRQIVNPERRPAAAASSGRVLPKQSQDHGSGDADNNSNLPDPGAAVEEGAGVSSDEGKGGGPAARLQPLRPAEEEEEEPPAA